MPLRVLGPIELLGPDGPRVVGATKQRTLLAALAIRRGSAWPAEMLIDALWGETPPVSASKLLQVYVSQLRRLLPDDVRIETHGGAYRLVVADPDLDAAVFERHVEQGRRAQRAGNPGLAASRLRRAIAQWRGPAYADVRYEEFAVDEIERLEALRELAIEARIDADLQLGRHAEVLGELRGMLAADPTRESIAAAAMIAAFRSTGSAEALEIFGTVREALLRELGAEPGPELTDLRSRIERRDPGLHLPAAAGPDSRLVSPLPAPPNELLGRERELAELRALVLRPDVRLVSLTGAGGSGKSRLGLELARQLAESFANGVIVIELASLGDAELVPATIARAAGLEPGADPAGSLTGALAGQELLLVLDNLEHLRAATPFLVRLLAAAPDVVMLITSRVVLHASGEHVYPVAPLAERDARDLFVERTRGFDPSFTLEPGSEALVGSICRRLDCLPLAIELAAPRVRTLGLETLDRRLASRLTVLTGGPRDLPARQQTLREALEWSVRLLAPAHADVLARLAVFAGSGSGDAVRAVAGADDDALVELVDHSLVQAIDLGGEPRFRLLETVREFAYELLGERREDAESALTSWLVEFMDRVGLGREVTHGEAMRRIDPELDNLRDALRHAAGDTDPRREVALVAALWPYWWVRGDLAEAKRVADDVLDRRGIVPSPAGVRVARAAATLAWSLGETNRVGALASRALDTAQAIGDVTEQIWSLNLLGMLANGQGDFAAGERHRKTAIALGEANGDLTLANMARLNLGVTYMEAGRLDEARAELQAVLEYRRPEGLSEGVGYAHLNLGDTEYAAADLEAAERHFLAAAEAFDEVGAKVRFANALQGLAAVEVRTGRAESAARRLGAAAAILAETGWAGDGTALAEPASSAARDVLGSAEYERLFHEGAGTAGR